MTHTPLVLRTHQEVAVAAPLLLGYWPDGSVCAILVDSGDRIVLIMRWDHGADAVVPDLPDVAAGAAAPVAVHIVAFASAGDECAPLHPLARERAEAALAALRLPVGMVLAAATDGGHLLWTSADDSAGDERVHVIARDEIEACARRTGMPVWQASRRDYVNDIAPDLDASARVQKALESLHAPEEASRDAVIARARSIVVTGAGGDDEIAAFLKAVSDVQVRDTVLWDLMHTDPLTWSSVGDHLARIVAAAPDPDAAPAATLLAILRWQIGDGSRAGAAAERALAADPAYSLALLVERCLATGLHPATWREGLSELSREQCRRAA